MDLNTAKRRIFNLYAETFEKVFRDKSLHTILAEFNSNEEAMNDAKDFVETTHKKILIVLAEMQDENIKNTFRKRAENYAEMLYDLALEQELKGEQDELSRILKNAVIDKKDA